MDNNTRRILEDLEPYGVGANKDISSVLQDEMFKWDGSLNDPALQPFAKTMVAFLQGMQEAGLIVLHGDNYRKYGRGNISEGFLWFGSTPIGASITFKGLEQLNLERARQTNNPELQTSLLTNASLQQSNQISDAATRRQNRLAYLTLAVAFISAFGTFGTFAINFLKWRSSSPETIIIPCCPSQEAQPKKDTLSQNLLRVDSISKKLKDTNKKKTSP